MAFVKRLLEAFLAGFAIATVVNVLVFPTTVRQVVVKQSSGYVMTLTKLIRCQQEYLDTMTSSFIEHVDSSKENAQERRGKAAKELKETMAALGALHGKLQSDLVFAKREIAWGHLDAKDLSQLISSLRQVLLPQIGLTCVVDIFERLVDRNSWGEYFNDRSSKAPSDGTPDHDTNVAVAQDWAEIASSLSPPFKALSEVMADGLTHVSYALKMAKRPKVKGEADPEAVDPSPKPGDKEFKAYLQSKIEEFSQARKEALQVWCSQRGFEFPTESSPRALNHETMKKIRHDVDERSRQQLFLVLYIEYLVQAAANAVLDLVNFADERVESGIMARKRLIFPGWKRLSKWFRNALDVDESPTTENAYDNTAGIAGSVYLGDAFKKQRDPEHLPPANIWEKLGDKLRIVPGFLAAPEVAFGFRVACATMSLAIVAYLEQTQQFFFQQRVVWAMIMIAIGMSISSAGSGVFGLVARVFGTICATAFSLLIWYIVCLPLLARKSSLHYQAGGQGSPGAVIPVLFVFLFIQFHFFLKYQEYTIVIIIALVTQILIVGYELEANKIGTAAIASNGQEYYPITLLAPFRLAWVAAGCFVAYIWTYFPFPITARTTLRHQLGEAMYLLANYYSIVHSTSMTRLSGVGGDPNDKTSPAAKLQKASLRLIGKILGLLSRLKEHQRFVKWEVIGGKFPIDRYGSLIQETRK